MIAIPAHLIEPSPLWEEPLDTWKAVNSIKTIPKRKPRKSVRFHSQARRIETTKTIEEAQPSYWYTKKEYTSFQEDMQESLAMFHGANQGLIPAYDTTRYTVAGMENMLTPERIEKRKINSKHCKHAVIEMQHLQRSGQFHPSPEFLRSVSLSFSEMSVQRAQANATKLRSLEY